MFEAFNHVQSPTDFDRLLVPEDHRSIVWIFYMACAQNLSEYIKAKGVAKRAVNYLCSSNRIEEEKINTCSTYLSLGINFGTTEGLDFVYQRALERNDKKTMMMKYAEIRRSGKGGVNIGLAMKAYQLVCDKFPRDEKCWVENFRFLYKVHMETESNSAILGNKDDKFNYLDHARQLLPRTLGLLNKKQHATLVIKIGTFGFDLKGNKKRGTVLFEESIKSHNSRRLGILGVYLDVFERHYDLEKMINVYEGVCCVKRSDGKWLKRKAFRMKFFFKRWMKYKESKGSKVGVEIVGKKARELCTGLIF